MTITHAEATRRMHEAPARPEPETCRPAQLPGITILDEIEGYINRHIYLPTPHNARVMALMAAASYATPLFPATFRGLFAGKPQSGKTTAMMITVHMSANPVDLSGTEPGARSAILGAADTPELGLPTFYLDDIKLFGDSGTGRTRDFRADVLRRGYKIGETYSVSRTGVAKSFNISAPFHMSGLEAVVPADIRTRCIVLWHEEGKAEQYYDLRYAAPMARAYGASLKEAVQNVLPDLAEFRGHGYHPKLWGRALEVWEPLLAVAKHVGGQKWVNYCVAAFVALTGNGSNVRQLTPRQKVIRDAVAVMDGPLAWAAAQGFIPGDLLGPEFARLTEGGKRSYAGMSDNALLQHIAANMLGVRKRQVGGLLRKGYPIDRMMGYLAQDIRDEWELIRPDEPQDVEAPEDVSPFEACGEDDGDLDALLQEVQGVQGVPGIPSLHLPLSGITYYQDGMSTRDLTEWIAAELTRLDHLHEVPWSDAGAESERTGSMRQQIGTVRITRPRIYKLDPWTRDDLNPATVIVEPGEYPVYLDGFTRYWRMTGVLNHQTARLGDGMFAMHSGDVRSEDDVVFYSQRYGPDEWDDLLAGFAAEANPALVFTLDADEVTAR